MMKLQKNDKAFQELTVYAKSVSTPLKEVLLSDIHFEKVTEIFYSHMPKMVRFAMNKDKFKAFYKLHREQFAAQIAL